MTTRRHDATTVIKKTNSPKVNPPEGCRVVESSSRRARPKAYRSPTPDGVVVVRAPPRLCLSNQYRRYNCVRMKFDGLLVVPCHSSTNRSIAVGTLRSFSAL